jgi:hypothetical protein
MDKVPSRAFVLPFCILTLSASGVATAHAAGARLSGPSDIVVLRTDIQDLNRSGRQPFMPIELRVRAASLPPSTLTINCVARCKLNYTQETTDTAMGAFVLGTQDRKDQVNIITLWQSATAWVVRVYNVRTTGVRLLLETGSNLAPEFSVDERGHEVISVPESVDAGGGQKAPNYRTIYRWNGTTFVSETRSTGGVSRP